MKFMFLFFVYLKLFQIHFFFLLCVQVKVLMLYKQLINYIKHTITDMNIYFIANSRQLYKKKRNVYETSRKNSYKFANEIEICKLSSKIIKFICSSSFFQLFFFCWKQLIVLSFTSYATISFIFRQPFSIPRNFFI